MSWHESGRDRDPWDDSNKGPPDLDDWFRRAWQWIRTCLGRSSPSQPPSGSRRFRLWWAVPVILIGIWLITGFYRVPDEHKAVTMRFGAYAGMAGPGLHWRWPWPIGAQETVNLGIDRSISRHAQVVTRDGKLATVRLTAAYRISDPRQYLFGSRQPDVLIAALADAALARAAREQSLEALRGGNISELEQHLKQEIAGGLQAAETGVIVQSVRIGHIELPDAVTDKTKQLTKLLDDKQKQMEKLRAQAEEKVSEAQRQASAIIAQAQQNAEQREALAPVRLAHFTALLPAWRKAPETTRTLLRSDVLFGTLAKLPKVVVSGSVHSVTLPPAATSATQAAPSQSTGKAAAAQTKGGEQS